jgi:uncharacterized protein (UPF0248 family)
MLPPAMRALMRQSVELLRRFRWAPGYDFGRVSILYTHRGAPGNEACISGDCITHVANTYLEVETGEGTTMVPYHRVLEIQYDGRVEWRKPGL